MRMANGEGEIEEEREGGENRRRKERSVCLAHLCAEKSFNAIAFAWAMQQEPKLQWEKEQE